ncbi:MAG: quinone-dependent dihydroorotate dehydrogenase [Thiolinea sp.]
MYSLLRKLLFLFPAETSHHLALNSLKIAEKTTLLGKGNPLPGKPVNVMGIDFPNPVGLAAGLDKNGEYIDAMAALGFGFIEIGTVTPRPQPGNPLPRMFRLPEAKAIINRMGFNNHGLDYLLGQVEKAKYQGVLGINIGKNADTAVERAVDDYLIALQRVYAHADYITVNISSPNTPGLRTLQYGDELQQLLATLKAEQHKLAEQYEKYVPLAVKVAPDLTPDEIHSMAGVFLDNKIDALIATNTLLDKTAVRDLRYGAEQGGLSGQPLTQKSTEVIRAFCQQLGDDVPVIGVGGIMSGEDAKAKMEAGAKLVQLYSGFIYAGPGLIKDCIKATSDS